jgi:hypothetical protein
MTRPQVRLYWHYLNRRKIKDLERQAMVMWGYDPEKKRHSRKQRDMAEKWQEDPLYGFPNDITYFTRQQISQKMAVSRRFGNKLRPETKWDEDRGKACIGRYGIVARRCSMNDKLWGIYSQAKARNIILTLNDIKRMIAIDIKRSRLYPPGWTDDSVSPPEWHLDKLRKEGKLDQILKEIEEAGSG